MFTWVHGIESEKPHHVIIMKSFFFRLEKTNDLFDNDFTDRSVKPRYILFSQICLGLTRENVQKRSLEISTPSHELMSEKSDTLAYCTYNDIKCRNPFVFTPDRNRRGNFSDIRNGCQFIIFLLLWYPAVNIIVDKQPTRNYSSKVYILIIFYNSRR